MEKMNSRDGVNYNLMNLKSNTLLIDFEFASSNDKFRFVISGKRNSKNFENVGTLTKKQYKFIDGKWVLGEYTAEEILELSYDNFKRTIIIPQGKFMEFLQLGDTERTKMLKEIFNLNKFDLSHKIGSLDKENNSQIDNLTGRLEQFKETNTEEIEKQKELLQAIENEKKTIAISFDKKNKEFKELENIKVLFENLKTAKENYDKLNSQKELFANKDKQIKAYELCLSNFKPLVDNIETSINKEKELSKNIKTQKTELENITKLIKENTQLFSQTEKEFKNIETYKQQVDEIGKIITTNKQKSNLTEVEKLIIITTANNKKQESDKTELEKKITNLKIEIKELEKNQADISELSKIKEWFVKKDSFDNETKTLNKNLTIKKQEFTKFNNRKESIIPSQKQEKLNIDFSKNISEIIELLSSKIVEFEKKLDQAKAKRDELIIKQELKKFSANLKSGKACPVCGSTEHPNPINIEEIDSEILKLKTQTENGEKYIANLRNYISDFKILESEINSANKNIKELDNQLKEKETELNTFIKSFNWKNYTINDKQRVISDFNNTEKTNKIIKQKRESIELELNKLATLTDDISKNKDEINKLELSKNEFNVQINTLLQQVKIIDLKLFENKSVSELTSEQNKISLKIKNIEENYNTLDKIIENLKLKEAKTASTVSGLTKQLEDIKTEISKINSQIDSKLKQYKYDNIKDVEAVLKQQLNIEKEKQNIKDFELHLNSVETTFNNIKKQTKDKSFDENIYQKIKTEILELSAKIEEINKKIGAYKNTIQKLSSGLKQKKESENQLKIKELRKHDIKVLTSLFHKQGFVQYVSTVYLQQLIDYANMRFHKLTKQSLSLVLGKNNNFDVIDYLNDGKRRSVKTLSGGQTFQASLSLALALAGSVQKLNKSDQNFFFLDEGFGTQDDESLRLVFEAIKSLRKENRIVGIISHVDELQEEITTNLRIVNDDKKGSLIYRSWE